MVGLVLTITLVAAEALAIVTIMPDVKDDLGGLAFYGWVFSAFMLASLVGIAFAGPLADERGPAAPFVAGLVLFSAGLVAGGLAPSMPALVAARVVQGLGAGAIPAVAYASIGRTLPERLRPRMFAVLSTAWVVPGIVGPVVAKFVSDAVGWRWVFLGLLPLVAFAGTLTMPALTGIGPPPAAERDPAHRRFRSLLPAGLLRAAPGIPAAVLSRALLTFAFFAADAFVPLAVEDVRRRPGLVALSVTAATLAWTAGAWVQARLYEIWEDSARIVRTGFVVLAAGLAGTSLLLTSDVPIALGLVGWTVAGFGIGMAFSPLAIVVLREAPPGREGASSAALSFMETVGIAAGTGVGGMAVAIADGAGWPTRSGIAVAFVLAFVSACAGAVVSPRVRGSAPAHAGLGQAAADEVAHPEPTHVPPGLVPGERVAPTLVGEEHERDR